MLTSKWFPAPHAWFKAARLLVPAYGGGGVVFAFIVWHWSALVAVAATSSSFGDSLQLILFPIGVLLIAFLWYLGLGFLWWMVLKLLIKSPPNWIKPSNQWSNIFLNFSVLIVSTLPIYIIFLMRVGVGILTSSTPQFSTDSVIGISAKQLVMSLSWLWVVLAAYLYHWQQPPAPTPDQLDEVDAELNHLKGRLGLHKMKRPRKKSAQRP